jgi:hypothetical protein
MDQYAVSAGVEETLRVERERIQTALTNNWRSGNPHFYYGCLRLCSSSPQVRHSSTLPGSSIPRTQTEHVFKAFNRPFIRRALDAESYRITGTFSPPTVGLADCQWCEGH